MACQSPQEIFVATTALPGKSGRQCLFPNPHDVQQRRESPVGLMRRGVEPRLCDLGKPNTVISWAAFLPIEHHVRKGRIEREFILAVFRLHIADSTVDYALHRVGHGFCRLGVNLSAPSGFEKGRVPCFFRGGFRVVRSSRPRGSREASRRRGSRGFRRGRKRRGRSLAFCIPARHSRRSRSTSWI